MGWRQSGRSPLHCVGSANLKKPPCGRSHSNSIPCWASWGAQSCSVPGGWRGVNTLVAALLVRLESYTFCARIHVKVFARWWQPNTLSAPLCSDRLLGARPFSVVRCVMNALTLAECSSCRAQRGVSVEPLWRRHNVNRQSGAVGTSWSLKPLWETRDGPMIHRSSSGLGHFLPVV